MECTKRERKESYFKYYTFCERADGVCTRGFEEVLHFETTALFQIVWEKWVFLALVEHPRLCHSWCQCVLKPEEMWGCTDPLPLYLYNVGCSQVQARVTCLKFILCGPEVTLNDLKFLHLCLLRLDSSSLETSSFGKLMGNSLLVTQVSSFRTFGQLTNITVGFLQSVWCASLIINLIQNPLGKTVGRWLIFLFVF